MATKLEEKEFKNLQVKFQVEMVNALAQHVTLTLTEIRDLECAMRTTSKQNFKNIVMTGPVEFRLIAAVVHENHLRGTANIRLRLEPKAREEYRYVEIFANDMQGFTGAYALDNVASLTGSWWDIYDHMLSQTEPTTGKLYEVLIATAAEEERKRSFASNINSHELYASW